MRQRTGVSEGGMIILNKTIMLPTQRKQSAAMSMLMNVGDCLRIILRRGMLMVKITIMETNANNFDKKGFHSSKASTASIRSNNNTEECLSKLNFCISRVLYMKEK
jgi:hypothetical protein